MQMMHYLITYALICIYFQNMVYEYYYDFTQEILDIYCYHFINQKIMSTARTKWHKCYINQTNNMNKPFCKTLQNIEIQNFFSKL